MVTGRPRLILQAFPTSILVALNPFAGRLTADPTPTSQFADRTPSAQILNDHYCPFVHDTRLVPWHIPNCNPCAWEKLSPISLVQTVELAGYLPADTADC